MAAPKSNRRRVAIILVLGGVCVALLTSCSGGGGGGSDASGSIPPPTTAQSSGGAGTTATTAPAAPSLPNGQFDVFDQGGVTMARVQVGSTVYTVAAGQTFATSYKVVSLSGTCGQFLFGDSPFSLCEGEQVIK